MDYNKLYAALLTATKETEAEKETPLFLAGIFFNTSEDKRGAVLDAEKIRGGADIIENGYQLENFLTAKEARAIFEALKADILPGFFEAYPDARK